MYLNIIVLVEAENLLIFHNSHKDEFSRELGVRQSRYMFVWNKGGQPRMEIATIWTIVNF